MLHCFFSERNPFPSHRFKIRDTDSRVRQRNTVIRPILILTQTQSIWNEAKHLNAISLFSFLFFVWFRDWLGRFGRLIITAKDGDPNLLRTEVFKELRQIDGMITNATVTYDGETFTYRDICAKSDDECFQNNILNLDEKMAEVSVCCGNGRYYIIPFMLVDFV